MLITNATLVLLGILITSSLGSLMHAFTGGAAGDYQTLDSLQFSGILFSLMAMIACLSLISRGRGIAEGIRVAWMHTPTWLILASVVVVSLAVVGELSYFLLRDAVWIPNDWFNHSALVCLSLATLAFLLVSGTGRYMSGRGPHPKKRW